MTSTLPVGVATRAALNIHNSFVPSANYGNFNFDIRSAFRGYAIYQQPFDKNRPFLNSSSLLDAVVGGWQPAGTLILQDGQHY
jgi:hypothetical protein